MKDLEKQMKMIFIDSVVKVLFASGQSISRILDIPGDNAYTNIIPSCNYKGKTGGTTNA